jgi:PAS domain S-box-containing protein
MALTGGQIGTWTLDLLTNAAVYDANSPRLFGLPAQPTTMQAASMLPFAHADDQDAVNAEIARAVETGHYNIEYRVRWPDGSIHFLAASAETIYDAGKAVKLTGACWDITGRKAAETALRLSEASLIGANLALQQSNRELEHFASIASHDLQEPLRKVQAFGDRLKTAYAANLDAQGLDFLNRMLNAAQRMQTLVNDLLAFSRVTSQNRPLTATDLGHILKEVVSDLEIRITETAALIQTEPLPTIDADPLLIRQLFQNLLSNALKFHKPGQPPTVRVRAEIDNAAACRIIVEDDGIGFDEKYLDRIFTIFQRLHGRAEYPGTGIGLAICRKIAQRHGGDVTAHSAPGCGAAFIVTLPCGSTLPQTT